MNFGQVFSRDGLEKTLRNPGFQSGESQKLEFKLTENDSLITFFAFRGGCGFLDGVISIWNVEVAWEAGASIVVGGVDVRGDCSGGGAWDGA